ncbi:phosphoribosylformylglycinamidine synthase I [Sulfuriroseicoccus oceanibius]|uniref:Phosphoribosylformylglycinamidine synthase I n=1 Tax=Sulfuriroseicoccus oceanibius TaxID=2707525 RepID=A0A6B3LBG0_9BACT|nr:phosphoribosylformylglycinamidine synthase I [Sulfuriroseicoccus oceanibius]QQL44127.1 phosphoribosylformylglycinamidine synthase I [Sulfuriroseicoccus oceanibius]
MENRPHAILLKFPGTNCDEETARALETVGFSTETLPISRVTPDSLAGAKLVMLSGGFSYGDYVMAGRIAQLRTEAALGDALKSFVENGGYVLGVCNGFQILTKLSLLPEGSLIHNDNGRFICRWAGLAVQDKTAPVLSQLPDVFELPVAHAEGRFVAPEGKAAEYLEKGYAALTYTDDINGSSELIAGVRDESGRVFGLMPHPERFLYQRHHYDQDWNDAEWGWGYYFFKGLHDAIVAG